MRIIVTYQDLLSVGSGEKARGSFVRSAVDAFRLTQEYRDAAAGEAYYAKHNTTIERFQKYLYKLNGEKIPDLFSANYKLKTSIFRRFVLQQTQYLLANGAVFENAETKDKLGQDFDIRLQQLAKRALCGGQAFCFWNYDHLEVFGLADTRTQPGFCPLRDENSGKLMAGIRFWFRRVGDHTLFHAVLYEQDGYTEYIQSDKSPITVKEAKRAYVRSAKSTDFGGIESVSDVNYGQLPIVPMYANDSQESEIVGIRENIDCYDFIKSGLANDIDDASGFYWILKNSGGMDDPDLARFIQRMKTVRAAVVEGDAGADAEPHTLSIPYEAKVKLLEILRSDLYEDFQIADVKSLSAAQKTTQEIQAAYQAMDNKVDDFEYQILECVYRVMEIAGIPPETVSFVRSRLVNQPEQVNMILTAAPYLDDETIIRHLPFLTPEEAERVIAQRSTGEYARFNMANEEDDSE